MGLPAGMYRFVSCVEAFSPEQAAPLWQAVHAEAATHIAKKNQSALEGVGGRRIGLFQCRQGQVVWVVGPEHECRAEQKRRQ